MGSGFESRGVHHAKTAPVLAKVGYWSGFFIAQKQPHSSFGRRLNDGRSWRLVGFRDTACSEPLLRGLSGDAQNLAYLGP